MKPAERISRKGWRAALVGQPTGRRSTHLVEAVVGRRRRLLRELLRLTVETAAPAPGQATSTSGSTKTSAGATTEALNNSTSTL